MVNAPIPVIAILIVHDPDAMGQAPVPPDEPHLMGVHHTHLYTLLPPLMGVHLNCRIPCRKLLHILLMLLILLRFVSRAVPSPRAKLAPSGLLVTTKFGTGLMETRVAMPPRVNTSVSVPVAPSIRERPLQLPQ